MIDTTLAAVLIEQALLLVATVATLRYASKETNRRVGDLEQSGRELGKDFVPRPELEALLRNIEKQTEHTNSLVQAMIYAGCDRTVAIKAIEAAAEGGSTVADLAWIEFYLQAVLPKFEGRVPFFYLDVAGHVTIGCGAMVPDAAEALRLPLRDRNDVAASPEAIVADFRRVSVMRPGRLASFYRCASSLRLSADDALDIDRRLCAGFVAELRLEFPGFDAFPAGAKLGLLDMVVNMGLGRPPRDEDRGDGLLAFTHLCADVRLRNWNGAANDCVREEHCAAFDARNAWTRTQFLSAALSHAQNGAAL